MKSLSIWVVSLALSSSALAATTGRLQFKVVKHQPCTASAPASERIRFSSIEKAPLVRDDLRGDGCYAIPGPATVRSAIVSPVQLYGETRYGTQSSAQPCIGANSSGYGGVGSCISCASCSSADQTDGPMQLLSNTAPVNWAQGLAAGTYSNLRISFCMPTREQFLTSQGIDEATWEQERTTGRMVFMTLYVFNRSINRLPLSDLQKIATADSAQIIGCHRIVGSVYEPNP